MTNAVKNTKGAAAQLECSENWVHKLVSAGRLKAYAYDEQGTLVERDSQKRQGQGLYFYESDLRKYKNAKHRKPGRPAGAKDKHPRVSGRDENSSECP